MTAKNVGKVFDGIAGEWELYRKQPSSVLPLFLPMLSNASVVLDAGCGNARNAVVIAEKARAVYGVDASKKMLENAVKRVEEAGLNNVELFEADFLRLPFPNGFFDAAFYLACLHHLTARVEQEKAFREMARVLKDDGLAFVTVWNKFQKRFWEKKTTVGWRKKDGVVVKRPHYFFDEKELASLADAVGFVVEKIFFEKQGREVGVKDALNLCVVLKKK